LGFSLKATAVQNSAEAAWQNPASALERLATAADLLRNFWIRVALISGVLLVPCFWQRRIEAGDLRSHIYNAWLVQLIERGQAPGLWLAPVHNNVLFDYLLSGLARIFSLPNAARLACGIVVLMFFWGAFSFVGTIAGRSVWALAPLLAAVTYGWTFQEGFLNYELSLGLAFAGLALFLRSKTWGWVALLLIAPVAFLAHPIGAVWMLAAALYLALLQLTPLKFHSLLACLAIVAVVVLHFAVQSRYLFEYPSSSALYTLLFYNGLDQLILTLRYVLPVLLVVALLLVGIAGEIRSGMGARQLLARSSKPLQLYLVVQAAIVLLPNAIYFPQYPVPISALTTRLTSISSVLLCCLLGTLHPQKWQRPVLWSLAVLFFVFVYQDTAVLNRMEDQVERLVQTIPAGQRVISTIGGPPRYRFSTKHLPDFSCIGHCFSYGNYEAPSSAFRIRAAVGNPFVVSDIHDATLMEEGRYVVRARDLPLYQLYQCSPDWTQLCIQPLKEGQRNDLYGVHPGADSALGLSK